MASLTCTSRLPCHPGLHPLIFSCPPKLLSQKSQFALFTSCFIRVLPETSCHPPPPHPLPCLPPTQSSCLCPQSSSIPLVSRPQGRTSPLSLILTYYHHQECSALSSAGVWVPKTLILIHHSWILYLPPCLLVSLPRLKWFLSLNLSRVWCCWLMKNQSRIYIQSRYCGIKPHANDYCFKILQCGWSQTINQRGLGKSSMLVYFICVHINCHVE